MDEQKNNAEPQKITESAVETNEIDASAVDARRKVLQRLGIAAVAAPVLMGVLKAEKAVASTGPGIPGGGGPGGGGSTVIP